MNTTRKPVRPAIYVRISDDREGEAKGVARQLEDCRALVESRGWPVAAEYNDNDVSAWKRGTVRPAYRQLLADVEDGAVDAVVVYDPDRLYRQPRELEEFIDTVEDAKRTPVIASVTGDVDLSTGSGRMQARVGIAMAAKSSDDASRRIKRKALELAQAGAPSGGPRRYGFERDGLTVRESEARVLREAADRVLAGESVRSLASEFTGRGDLTAQGKPWNPSSLSKMLRNPRIAGLRVHGGEVVGEAQWPAIVAPEVAERLRVMLADPARRTVSRARRYLLTGGISRCGTCGEPLHARSCGQGRRYGCFARPDTPAACGRVYMKADPLEATVMDAVFAAFEGPELPRALKGDDADTDAAIYADIDAVNRSLEELAVAYGQQAITMAEWLAARGPLEERAAAAKRALARSTGTTAVAEFVGNGSALRNAWDGLSLARRRTIIGAALESVTIAPAKHGGVVDLSRVSLTWRA